MPARDASQDPHFTLRLPRRSLRIAAIALGVGGLLALLAMWLGRDKGFYTVPPVAPASSGDSIPALPEPMAPGGDASGLPPPAPRAEQPKLVETPPPPPPEPVRETDKPVPAQPASSADTAATSMPTPIPGQNAPPEYPARAMRSGETGTVLVRVMVGPDGVPTDVEVAQRSGSRDLDRAALGAVRHWRFRPARRNGQPVAASIDIPIDFQLER